MGRGSGRTTSTGGCSEGSSGGIGKSELIEGGVSGEEDEGGITERESKSTESFNSGRGGDDDANAGVGSGEEGSDGLGDGEDGEGFGDEDGVGSEFAKGEEDVFVGGKEGLKIGSDMRGMGWADGLVVVGLVFAKW